MTAHMTLVYIDEYLFNKKRPHSKKEVVSVVSDGALFLLPQVLAIFVAYDPKWEFLYKFLGALSMISIVKNEMFYENLCMRERVIHACLYVMHPLILFTFYESWQQNYFDTHPNFWMFQLLYVGIGFKTVVYKLIYWNYIHDK
jgi:hypothetical protein